MEIKKKLSQNKKRKTLLMVICILVLLSIGGALLSIKSGTWSPGTEPPKPGKAEDVTVTVEIRCDAVSENMDLLENKAAKEYIPKDGTILAKTTYKGTSDQSVFDALNDTCRNNDIHIEYNYTPAYKSYYVEGINYLYEFDCGQQSGWMFKVNDQFQNYGCSSCYLKDGDEIVWLYTCGGLGQDIGAPEQ